MRLPKLQTYLSYAYQMVSHKVVNFIRVVSFLFYPGLLRKSRFEKYDFEKSLDGPWWRAASNHMNPNGYNLK